MNLGSYPPLTCVLSSSYPDGVDAWAESVRQQQATIQAQQQTIQRLRGVAATVLSL